MIDREKAKSIGMSDEDANVIICWNNEATQAFVDADDFKKMAERCSRYSSIEGADKDTAKQAQSSLFEMSRLAMDRYSEISDRIQAFEPFREYCRKFGKVEMIDGEEVFHPSKGVFD
ncbi:MAG: hypothetical protein CMK32_08215 [Porticoccaceae bacterium]|nr:hypothetical protein [Porticoccaceae bacterium]